MNRLVFAVCALEIFCIGHGVPTVTRDTKVDLPGREKINRRSPQKYIDKDVLRHTSSEEVFPYIKRSPNSKQEESMELAENGLVFRPLFHQKQQSNVKRAQRSLKEEEMKTAETGIVYVPLFKSKEKFETKHRVRRSTGLTEASNKVVGMPEDLEMSEDIVFKPSQKRKTRRTHYNDDDIFGSRLVFQNQYS